MIGRDLDLILVNCGRHSRLPTYILKGSYFEVLLNVVLALMLWGLKAHPGHQEMLTWTAWNNSEKWLAAATRLRGRLANQSFLWSNLESAEAEEQPIYMLPEFLLVDAQVLPLTAMEGWVQTIHIKPWEFFTFKQGLDESIKPQSWSSDGLKHKKWFIEWAFWGGHSFIHRMCGSSWYFDQCYSYENVTICNS